MPNPLLRGGQGRAAHDVLDSGMIIIVVILLAAIAWASFPSGTLAAPSGVVGVP